MKILPLSFLITTLILPFSYETANAQTTPIFSYDQIPLGKIDCGDIRFTKTPEGARFSWIDIRFTVLPNGRLADVETVGQVGRESFHADIMRALSKCRFSQPKKENGKPIAVRNIYTRFSYIEAPAKPGVGVKEKLAASEQLLIQGKLDEAAATLDEAEQAANSFSEMYNIIIRRALLMTKRGRDDIALRYLHSVPFAAVDEERIRVLRMRLSLELKLGLLASAGATGRKLADAKPDPETTALLATLDQQRQFGASGQPLEIQGRVPAECTLMICDPAKPGWEYVPTNRTISLANPVGHLDQIAIRCTHQTLITAATIGTTWTIPASFGQCAVEVTGEPGATFTLIDETIPS
ncbi:energy transducer TonB [Niveispirillum irakense]|uniref:energy transducer TonB n=1 Tax=Niveispirillum irakense TaxID=34011 RepID=UPI00048C03C7|nr:hypothetical protein [Niveispirillum irakense]